MHLKTNNTVLALDVGERRIGVASANVVARIANPLTTLTHTPQIIAEVNDLIKEHDAVMLVVGLPRGLDGQRTKQTEVIEQFVANLTKDSPVPVYLQDEAVTSHKAEAELTARRKPYAKEDIDALAATYILEDFLEEHPEVRA